MKINKTLAAGIAATLAVTSLASAASAVTAFWDMAKTYGKITYKPVVSGVTAVDPGEYFDFAGPKADTEKNPRDFKIKEAVGGEAGVDTNLDGQITDLDFDYYIPFKITAETSAGTAINGDDANTLLNCFDKISVLISGKRVASNGATTENVTQTIDLVPVSSATCGAGTANYILPIYNGGAPADGCFIPERFVQVDKIDFKVSAANSVTFDRISKDDWTKIQNGTKGVDGVWHPCIVLDTNGRLDILYGGNDAIEQSWENHVAKIKIRLADAYNDNDDPKDGYDNATVAYKVTNVAHGNVWNAKGTELNIITGAAMGDAKALSDEDGTGVPAADKHDGGLLLSKIRSTMANGAEIYFDANGGVFDKYDEFAYLPRTEKYDLGTDYWHANGQGVNIQWTDTDDIMQRDEIWKLSDTNDYLSTTDNHVSTGSENVSNSQTYTVDDQGNEGTIPKNFNGMASKFADFFNSEYGYAPMKDAKVIFQFVAFTPAATDNTWKNGGIPSTEVGLRNFLDKQDVKDFALFVNYNSTTGSLFATATLDKESGSVIFDVTNILQQLRGQTIGVVTDIYYGLANGIDQYNAAGNWVGQGLWVQKVTFEGTEVAESATDAKTDAKEEETETKPDANKEEENKGDVEINIDGNEKEDTTPSNNGGTVVDNGGNKADENPHTGVALAVVPAIVAGAAVVVSKKRK